MWLRAGPALVCKQLSVFILHMLATGAGTEGPPWRGRRSMGGGSDGTLCGDNSRGWSPTRSTMCR